MIICLRYLQNSGQNVKFERHLLPSTGRLPLPQELTNSRLAPRPRAAASLQTLASFV